MKAWVLENQAPIEDKPLKLLDIHTPHPKKNEVRIKVLNCGICRTDIHIAEGDLPLRKSPIILGHEVVGIVDEVGENAHRFHVGDKAGAYWLHSTCGKCKYCLSQRENYCPSFKATGWDENGGFAEYMTIIEAYALPLNAIQMASTSLAPLMCPGIAGYAALKLANLNKGERLGLFGFGPTAYISLKIAQYLGVETYVSTRSKKNIDRAKREGAEWAADASKEEIPCRLDAAILFPPAGNLVEPILHQLEKGGTLVLAPVSASPIHIENYSKNLWGRTVKTLYHLTRSNAIEFVGILDRLSLEMETCLFPFEALPDALVLAKHGKLERPNAVIKISD
jgi:propanol-preferring alcohol dehydrogenase